MTTVWALALAALSVLSSHQAVADDAVPIIDVHIHFQSSEHNLPGSADSAVRNMEKFGIVRSILMPPPYETVTQGNFYDIENEQFVMARHPGRFALVGGSALNAMLHGIPEDKVDDKTRARFRAAAERVLAAGAIGFGEIAIHHVSIPAMGARHAYERISPTHPFLNLLADIAAEHDVPIDIHIDLVPTDMPLPDRLKSNPLNPQTLQANAEAFKEFLSTHPRTTIIWSHVGFEPLLNRHPERVRAFLTQFPNLYMSFRLNQGAPPPAAAIDENGQVKLHWLELIKAFPDRFMLGSDAFFDTAGIARGATLKGFENSRALVAALPEPARGMIANGNAKRVFHLE